jgi:hypothetical protein
MTAATLLLYVFQTGYVIVPLALLILVLVAALVEQALPTKTKITKVATTFLQYQLILVEGMVRYLTGHSLHKWQKVQKNT